MAEWSKAAPIKALGAFSLSGAENRLGCEERMHICFSQPKARQLLVVRRFEEAQAYRAQQCTMPSRGRENTRAAASALFVTESRHEGFEKILERWLSGRKRHRAKVLGA